VSATENLVSVRRNVWLSGVVGGLAALIGLGYLLRGSGGLDTVIGIVLLLVAAVHASAVWAVHTPALVADEHGIRLRVGTGWRGLPWGAVRQLVVEHTDNPLGESRLVVVPRDPSLRNLGALGRLHVQWNRLWYGADFSVPLGMTTLTDSTDLAGDLFALADGRTDVVALRGRRLAQLRDVTAPSAESHESFEDRHADVSGAEGPEAEDAEPEAFEPEVVEPEAVEPEAVEVEPEPEVFAVPDPVDPVRPLSHPARVEVRLDAPAITGREAVVPPQRLPEEVGSAADLEDTSEVPDLVHVEAWEELPVEVEADDLHVTGPQEKGPEPVIGPMVARARDMLDMSIDELSERTRIRPHVLEAIEAEDFGPCGGDFYARGHLTAIARVLGLNLESVLKEYDERYAGGPINARRVFEAELATGMSSGMRATRGGPQWSLLIGAVLCLALVWGVARLLAGDPAEVAVPPASSGDSAGLAANRQPITSPLMKTTTMTVTAAHAGAHVVVKDRTGKVLWSGDLRMTHHRRIVGLAPFTVASDNAGAIEVTVAGESMGTLGTAGKAASKRFE
jgi:hypothetical protein